MPRAKTESEGIAGHLKAKALAIGGEKGNELAVLLTVDCGAVPADLREEVFRRVAGSNVVEAGAIHVVQFPQPLRPQSEGHGFHERRGA